jgi:probable rRNA maturation factor
MILLDPDLEPDPAAAPVHPLQAAAAPIGARTRRIPRFDRMPSIPTLKRFLAQAQEAVRLTGHVTVLLTTDAALRKLNRQFRGKNKATDVLSFPAEAFIGSKEKVAGDLAISVDTARKQAAEQGHALASELKILMLHGLLHLAGYDHETDDGAMARRELKLRAKLELPMGLIERAESPSGAKAPASASGVNVRAKARTLQSEARPPRSSVPTLGRRRAVKR